MKENEQVAKTATSSLKQSFNNKKKPDKKQKTNNPPPKKPQKAQLTKMNDMESLCSDCGKGKNTIQMH